MALQLGFLGGAGTVTGSKYALQNGRDVALVDCGLFQGFKTLRLKNWAPLPIDPRNISSVVLTHAHLDHSGYLPLLVRNGFRGPIFASRRTPICAASCCPTPASCRRRTPSSPTVTASRNTSRRCRSTRRTTRDAASTISRRCRSTSSHALTRSLSFRMHRAGHILGAASLQIEAAGTTIVFSGDLGRYNDPTMVDPVGFDRADYLVVESTYGDRRHSDVDPEQAIGDVVETDDRARRHGGDSGVRGRPDPEPAVPSRAARRTRAGSPMCRFFSTARWPKTPATSSAMMSASTGCRERHAARACGVARYVRSVEESKALDRPIRCRR